MTYSDKSIKEWSDKCFVILINEVAPRAKKLGVTINEFCSPEVIGFLSRLEFENCITRKELRSILDLRVHVLKDNGND